MIFAEFYRTDLAGRLSLATGDRSILILDGRNAEFIWHTIATAECEARGYEAYQLRKGRGFTDSKAASGLVLVTKCAAGVKP